MIYILLYISVSFHLKFKENLKIGIDLIIQREKAFQGALLSGIFLLWGLTLYQNPTLQCHLCQCLVCKTGLSPVSASSYLDKIFN